MTLGERIIKLRNSKGISQDTLAVALGVSRQSVSKWETDASVPELDKLIKLSEYFEVSLDELIKGEAYSSEPIPSALNQWWSQIDSWYREKAYLLGYVFVIWGLWGLVRIVLSVIAFCFKTWSTGGALALFGALLSAIIEHSLKIILGYHIVNHGKKKTRPYSWYQLGWGAILFSLFGYNRITAVSIGLLDLVFSVPLAMFTQSEEEVRLFLVEAISDYTGCFVLGLLGICSIVKYKRSSNANER